MFIDTHCHLTFPELRERWDDIRAAMSAAQVERAIVICTTIEEFDTVHTLAAQHDFLWCTVGVHPDNEDVHEPDVAELVRLGRRDRVVAVGECGLDYYRLGERTVADMQWQRERLRTHVRAARELGRPLVIHTRSAAEDTLRLLREENAAEVGGVFHCFTETLEVARAALDLNFSISFSGILTFKNAAYLREIAALVPLERCLIETDSPYLAPAPHRGKLNTPALVPFVARQLAEIKGLELETVARTTWDNASRMFSLPA
ncbi:MAG: TatD DNase family protein [Pseudomonadota bacterium]|nr:TatD DNase family protein [Pseudomonadota bacterium]